MQRMIEEEENVYLSHEDVKHAYHDYKYKEILGVIVSQKFDKDQKLAYVYETLHKLYVSSNRNETNITLVSKCHDNIIDIPKNPIIRKLGYTIDDEHLPPLPKKETKQVKEVKEVKKQSPGLKKDFLDNKPAEGCCQARKINSTEKCQNKPEQGKICCTEHHPQTQEEKKMMVENSSKTISSSDCSSNTCTTSTSSTHDHENHNHDRNGKCQYVNSNKPCKNNATENRFCKKCHKSYTDECTAHRKQDYCTIIVTGGLNKKRACGKPSCGAGLHICKDHYTKVAIVRKCDHVNELGLTCNADIKNPHAIRCGKHLNSVSYVEREPEREKNEDDSEEESEEEIERPKSSCNYPCKSGKLCASGANYQGIVMKDGKEILKAMCRIHANKSWKDSEKSKMHRCEAICASTGLQCNRYNVPEGNHYCGVHNAYEPPERCGAFDMNTLDRCTNNCHKDEAVCKGHLKYDGTLITDRTERYEIEMLKGWVLGQEHLYYNNTHPLVFLDELPPRKITKLIIVNDKPKKPLKLVLVNDKPKKPLKLVLVKPVCEEYGLDYFVSNSEDSDGTEQSEEIVPVVEEIKPKRTLLLVTDEFEAVNSLTGWSEEEIRIMRNKKIFKRFTDNKKQLNVEKSVFEAKKKLETYFNNAINDANIKYNGAKAIFSNVVRFTYHDLVDSLRSVMELAGVQKFTSREKSLEDCKEKIKSLRSLESMYNTKVKGLPVPEMKKKLLPMDIQKYIAAFEDVIYTVKKEMKEDIKYIKEFQEFTYNLPKKSRKSKYIENPEEVRHKKRIEFDAKYKAYFTKYIVRFAKVSLHKENLKGRLFGFANYFIDLLHKNAYEYSKFQRAFGGEFKKEDDKKVFYCDVFTIITQIIEDNLGKKEIMDYLDVDISFNLSSSEHQTEFSENLRQCRSSGKPRSDAISMLEFGVVEKFDTKRSIDEDEHWGKELLMKNFLTGDNLLYNMTKNSEWATIPFVNSRPVEPKKNNDTYMDIGRFRVGIEQPKSFEDDYLNTAADIIAKQEKLGY